MALNHCFKRNLAPFAYILLLDSLSIVPLQNYRGHEASSGDAVSNSSSRSILLLQTQNSLTTLLKSTSHHATLPEIHFMPSMITQRQQSYAYPKQRQQMVVTNYKPNMHFLHHIGWIIMTGSGYLLDVCTLSSADISHIKTFPYLASPPDGQKHTWRRCVLKSHVSSLSVCLSAASVWHWIKGQID